MEGKYLPIGSVVMLKSATKRLMITGFCAVSKENPNIVFDYSGCIFPEGIVSSDQTALFNHEQIDKIYFVGLKDEEEKTFKEQLNNIVNKFNK